MMHWMFGNYGTSCGPGMAWFMFFFWFLVILGIVMLLRALLNANKNAARPEAGNDSAEEILNKRYARGEISEEEYRKMRELLRS